MGNKDFYKDPVYIEKQRQIKLKVWSDKTSIYNQELFKINCRNAKHKWDIENINKPKTFYNTEEYKQKQRDSHKHKKPIRGPSELEIWMNKLLTKLNINFQEQLCWGYCKPDFLIPEQKIIIFTDSDYHHAHLSRFIGTDKVIGKKTAQWIWDKDNNINNKLKLEGYTVLRFWGTDIHYMPEEVERVIKEHVNCRN